MALVRQAKTPGARLFGFDPAYLRDDGPRVLIAGCSAKDFGKAPDDEADAGVSAHESRLSCCTAESSFPT
jgi:hypothetical protein